MRLGAGWIVLVLHGALACRSSDRVVELAVEMPRSVVWGDVSPVWTEFLEGLLVNCQAERTRAFDPTPISTHFEVQQQFEALGYL